MSQTLEFSVAVIVARRAASIETLEHHHRQISPELMLCGLTKLEDLRSREFLAKLEIPLQIQASYLAETGRLLEIFQLAGIEPRKLRHILRRYIGQGTYSRPNEEPVSRSNRVKAAFARAYGVALDHHAEQVMVTHLAAAVLEIPQTLIHTLLMENGVGIHQLIENLNRSYTFQISNPADQDIFTQEAVDDLTALAQRDKLDPFIKRKPLESRLFESFLSPKKKMSLLIGPDGVGKTAVVNSLSQRIAVGNLNSRLAQFRSKRIIHLDGSDWGIGIFEYKEWYERLEALFKAAHEDRNVILYISHIEYLFRFSVEGPKRYQLSRLLQIALNRYPFNLICAITPDGYQQFLAQNPTLVRSIELIHVDEATPQDTLHLLQQMRGVWRTQYPSVTIEDEALPEVINLSKRYLTDHVFPGKALGVIESACAKAQVGVNISYSSDQPLDASTPLNCVTPYVVKQVVSEMIGYPIMGESELESRPHLVTQKLQDHIAQFTNYELRPLRISLHIDDEVLAWLAKTDDGPQLTISDIENLFHFHIRKPILEMITAGELFAGEIAFIKIEDNRIEYSRNIGWTLYE